MKIDKYTAWSSLAPFATEKIMAELKEKIKGSAFFLDFWNLSVGHLAQILDGKTPQPILDVIDERAENITVFEVVKFLNGYDEFLKELLNALEKLDIKPTADEKKIKKGTLELSPAKSILIFTRKYFGLQSFGAAEKITILEYLIARQDNFNEIIEQRNLIKLQESKIKKK